ncbi:hypothetical protein EHM76_05590 [bacterium]|nr:MAG: hypothetical protein EHM76_05590 [bacterium]
MAVDTKGFAMGGSYYTSGTGILVNLFASWGLLADAPEGVPIPTLAFRGIPVMPVIGVFPNLARIGR